MKRPQQIVDKIFFSVTGVSIMIDYDLNFQCNDDTFYCFKTPNL